VISLHILNTGKEGQKMNIQQTLRNRLKALYENYLRESQAQTRVPTVDTSMDEGDQSYAWLKANHPEIHKYIKVDCPVPLCPTQTRRMVQQMGPHATMQMFRDKIKEDGRKMWDNPHNHPNL
jgi:coenzyme F420-reducing hydrogenase gamma subunit